MEDGDSIFHLASYVDAVARVVHALPNVDDELMVILEKLMLLLLEAFPRLYTPQRYVAHTSLARCFASLHLKGAILGPLYGRVARQGIIRACAKGVEHEAAVAAATNAEEQAADADPLVAAVAEMATGRGLLPVYIEFFRVVASGKHLRYVPQEELPTASRPALVQTLYDETLRALLSILHKLDLGTVAPEDAAAMTAAAEAATADAEEPEMHANPVLALRPRVPLDFVVLVQVVEFTTTWLRKTDKALFQRWVYPYVTQLVALSTKSPYVSGYYKLLQVRGWGREEERRWKAF